ncbi:MAG: VOC family protein [Chloroflexota bacterium]
MLKSIDHIVILVNDLTAAIRDYDALGFTVVPGGEHSGGRSRNALVAFEDGTYLELVAFRDNEVPPDHHFFRSHGQEGLINYALLPTDIQADIDAARERGLGLNGPIPGGRVRPDGQQIQWQTAQATSHDLPFLCGDITPRELRVPDGFVLAHQNGATGVSALGIVVNDIETSRERYSALLGPDTVLDDIQEIEDRREVAFHVGGTLVVLAQPTGPGEARDYLESRGEGPYLLILSAKPNIRSDFNDMSRTHGVHLSLASDPLVVNSVGEEYAYIAGLSCSRCGGSYRVVRQSLSASPGKVPMDIIEVVCQKCGQSGMLHFDISRFFGR